MYILEVYGQYLYHDVRVSVIFGIILFINTVSISTLQIQMSKESNWTPEAKNGFTAVIHDKSGLYVLTASKCLDQG